MLERGPKPADLEWFLQDPCAPDIIGINHYPLSNRFLDHRLERYPDHFHGGNGRISYVDLGVPQALNFTEGEGLPFVITPKEILREVYLRYKIPIAVTEVHIDGPRER